MAERPAPSNLRLILRLVACGYLLVLSVQMLGRIGTTEGTMRYVMIAAIVIFTGFSLVAIIGTLRRFKAMKAQAARAQAEQATTPEPGLPSETTDEQPAQPIAEASRPVAIASPVEDDELPEYFDLDTQLEEIERLAEDGKLEEMERKSERLKRALARQEAEEQES